jgi:cytochrome P450
MSGRLNLVDPEVLANPYPHFARLRRDSPVCQVDPGGMWAVTRYTDMMHVFKNPQLFSSAGLQRSMEPPWLGYNPMARSLLVMDGLEHGRARALVSRAFGSSTLTRLEPMLRATSEQLVGTLVERQKDDFLSALALPVPAAAIGHLLGLDASLHSRFKQWSDHLAAVSAIAESDLEGQQRIRHSLQELEHYLRDVVEARRREPREDLVTALLQARVEGEALTDPELMAFLFLLLAAGFETTANLLGNAALLMADQPELLERLRAEPALVPSFIEEVLRYESPAKATFRLTLDEVELGGVKLPRHSLLILPLGSACRDDAYVPDAERFVLGREQRGHLPFGHGAHFCLGAVLARMEARVVLETLLPRIQGLSRAPEPPQWAPSLQIRGLMRLPVKVIPA